MDRHTAARPLRVHELCYVDRVERQTNCVMQASRIGDKPALTAINIPSATLEPDYFAASTDFTLMEVPSQSPSTVTDLPAKAANFSCESRL